MATCPNLNWCIALKEYADAKKVSYHYAESFSGPQHDLTFHVKVKLDTFTAEGTGKTKRAAKSQAAQLLMELINPGGNNPQSDISMRKGNQHDNAKVVGELQEFCQRKKWTLPVYEEEACQSLQHTCRCKVKMPMEEYKGEVCIRVKGSGESKRVAKGHAAENALNLIKLFTKAVVGEPQRDTLYLIRGHL